MGAKAILGIGQNGQAHHVPAVAVAAMLSPAAAAHPKVWAGLPVTKSAWSRVFEAETRI